MQLMFASDIHGSLPATEKVLAIFAQSGAQWLVLVGDLLTHGHLFNPDNMPPLAPHDALIFGHTHLPVAEKRDGFYFFNPGSVSIPKGGFEASYGMLNDGVLSVRTLNNDGVIARVGITP